MNANDALAQIRTILGYVGSVLVLIALAKFAGIAINVRGEYWQIAILGWALKAA